MPAHVVYGDPFLASKAVQDIIQQSQATDIFQSNVHHTQADSADPAQVITNCYTMPFLSAMRLVTVEGIFAAVDRQRAAAEGSRRSRPRKGEGWAALADAIPNLPDTTLLILVDQDIRANNALLRQFSKHCQVHHHQPPQGPKLNTWINDLARQKGANITGPATQLMALAIGPDLWAIDRELEKLSIYCGDQPITPEAVNLLVHHVQETNIFSAIDAAVAGNTGEALRAVTHVMADGAEPPQLLGLINRQLRLMAIAHDHVKRGTPHSQMAKHMGVTSQFVVRKTTEQIKGLTDQHIQDLYQLALDTDLSIKTGRSEPAIAVELLISDIANIQTKQQPPRTQLQPQTHAPRARQQNRRRTPAPA